MDVNDLYSSNLLNELHFLIRKDRLNTNGLVRFDSIRTLKYCISFIEILKRNYLFCIKIKQSLTLFDHYSVRYLILNIRKTMPLSVLGLSALKIRKSKTEMSPKESNRYW